MHGVAWLGLAGQIFCDDVDLFVYLRGGEVANAATMSGNESVQFVAKAGEEYVINVQGYVLDVNGPYQAILKVTP